MTRSFPEVERIATIRVPTTLREQLAGSGFAAASITRLMDFLERIEVEDGEYLIRQRDETDDLLLSERLAATNRSLEAVPR